MLIFLEEVSETLDLVQDVLDDVWKMDSYQVYSQIRMRHLMHLIGNLFEVGFEKRQK